MNLPTLLVAPWQQAKQQYSKSKKLTAKKSLIPLALLSNGLFNTLLQAGRHDEIRHLSQLLLKTNQTFAYYFLAQSYYLCYELDEALIAIDKFLLHHNRHADGLYLKSEILVQKNEALQAKSLLQSILLWSQRGKTWQLLANLVENDEDFTEYLSLLDKFYDLENLPYDIANHVTHAAYMGGCVDYAHNLWRKQYLQNKRFSTSNSKQKQISNKKYSQKDASKALQDLKHCLNKNQIEFFLISGTLLGCIREGALLGHDKDIDIGVWHTTNYRALKLAFQKSGLFYILPSSNKKLLVVRHVNGIAIDVFIHEQNNEGCWHYGGKCKWLNTPFKLKSHQFLGTSYMIPENHDQYLTENYGDDWRLPKIDFDSALDTPNMHIVDDRKMQVYFFKRLVNPNHHLSERLRNRIENYLSP